MIFQDYSNIKSCNSKDKFVNSPTDYEKSLSESEGSGKGYNENIPIKEQNTILPNSERLSSSSCITSDREEIWDDFRKYIINEAQRKHRLRNKVGYTKRYCQILETKDARVPLNLSPGCKVAIASGIDKILHVINILQTVKATEIKKLDYISTQMSKVFL